MADYYYAELLFDPDDVPFVDCIARAVNALIGAGCEFREIVVPKQRFTRDIKWGEFSSAGLGSLREMCDLTLQEGLAENRHVVSFPPGWGRVMFEYKFAFDPELEEEIWDEEEETNALVTDLGAAFSYSPTSFANKYIKLTISFWEDFVLRHGNPETHVANFRKITSFWESIAREAPPYFGVMNNELHINHDRSLDALKAGQLPEGNEYVLVGNKLLGLLDQQALAASGRKVAALADGSVLIEFTDRWVPSSAL